MEVILIGYIGLLNILLAYFIHRQHVKTRKELQEVKTKLTWIKKRQKGGKNEKHIKHG
jgi:hypothetical protein